MDKNKLKLTLICALDACVEQGVSTEHIFAYLFDMAKINDESLSDEEIDEIIWEVIWERKNEN